MQWDGTAADHERLLLPPALVPVHARTDRPSSRCTSPTAARSSRAASAGRRSPSTSAPAASATARARRACSRRGSPRATCRSCRPRTPTQRGVRYRQESFVGRAYGAYGARSVISFVRLVVDARARARRRDRAARPVASGSRTRRPTASRSAAQTRLIVSDGAEFVDGVVRYRVPARRDGRRSTPSG